MAMIRVEPVEVHVRTGWFDGTPREITWGDERLPVTRLDRRARGSRRVSGHHRSADPVRGRDAASPTRAHLPAPLAALDDHGARRPPSGGLGEAAQPPGGVPARRDVSERERARRYRARSASGLTARRPPRVVAGVGATYNRAMPDPEAPSSFRDLTVAAFVDELASSAPVPGGGQRVGRGGLARRSPRRDGRDRCPRGARSTPSTRRSTSSPSRSAGDWPTRLLDLADEDAVAYGEFAAALKLPKDTDAERDRRTRRDARGSAPSRRRPARHRRGLSRAGRHGRDARRPEQRQRVERPRGRGAPRAKRPRAVPPRTSS